jgi:hypothetical protein
MAGISMAGLSCHCVFTKYRCGKSQISSHFWQILPGKTQNLLRFQLINKIFEQNFY